MVWGSGWGAVFPAYGIFKHSGGLSGRDAEIPCGPWELLGDTPALPGPVTGGPKPC